MSGFLLEPLVCVRLLEPRLLVIWHLRLDAVQRNITVSAVTGTRKVPNLLAVALAAELGLTNVEPKEGEVRVVADHGNDGHYLARGNLSAEVALGVLCVERVEVVASRTPTFGASPLEERLDLLFGANVARDRFGAGRNLRIRLEAWGLAWVTSGGVGEFRVRRRDAAWRGRGLAYLPGLGELSLEEKEHTAYYHYDRNRINFVVHSHGGFGGFSKPHVSYRTLPPPTHCPICLTGT